MAKREPETGDHSSAGEEHVTAEAIVNVLHPAGLHMRTAADFVRMAAQFSSSIRLLNLSRPGAREVHGKSMLGVMNSGVSTGHRIRIRAEGSDAVEAVAALRALVERDFKEL